MKKYEHINFQPPVSVAKAAEKGLKYREMAGGKGGLTVEQAKAEGIGSGVQRAVNLKNRDTLSPDTVKRMKAFFDRHQKNKAIDPKHKDEPWKDRGYVAWLIWGGDPGYAWARKVVTQMEKADRMGKKVAARFLKLSQEHGRSPKEIQDDNAIEWAKDLAELNKEIMKMPGGKTNPESGRTLNQGLKSSEMLFRRKNLNQAPAEDIKAALEIVFEDVKYVDKDIVDYVKQKRKIDWKPKGKISADMAMKVVARFAERAV